MSGIGKDESEFTLNTVHSTVCIAVWSYGYRINQSINQSLFI